MPEPKLKLVPTAEETAKDELINSVLSEFINKSMHAFLLELIVLLDKSDMTDIYKSQKYVHTLEIFCGGIVAHLAQTSLKEHNATVEDYDDYTSKRAIAMLKITQQMLLQRGVLK